MKKFLPIIGVLVVAALTLASGIIRGGMSGRWGPPKELQNQAKNLDNIPNQFAHWEQLGDSEEFSEIVVNELECVGNTVRTYRNSETGEVVQAAIFVGPPGPTSQHTPEVCFGTRDHKLIDEPRHVPFGDDKDSQDIFWGVTFRANNLEGTIERVYYAWNAGGHWSAPKSPRFAFAGQPHLYKIQLISNLPAGTDLEKTDPCRKFLQDFLPVLAERLFAELID